MTRRIIKEAFESYPIYVIATLLLAIIHALIEGAGFGLLLPIIEGLQSPESINPTHPISLVLADMLAFMNIPYTMNILFVVGISLFFFQAALEYLRTAIASRIIEKVEINMRVRLYSNLLNAVLGFYHRKKVGDLVNGIVLEAHRAANAFSHLISTIVSALLVTIYFAVSFLVTWQLSLMTFLLVLPLIYITRGRTQIQKKGQEITRANEEFQSVTVEFLLGTREIKILGLVNEIAGRFKTVASRVSRQGRQLSVLHAKYAFVYQVIAVVFLFLLVGVGNFLLEISPVEMAIFLAILLRLSPVVTQLQKNRDKYLGTLPGFEAIEKLHQEVVESLLEKIDSEQAIDVKALTSSIEFKNVSFAYEGSQTVLEEINLIIERGKTLAIVGSSGAGKSTLVDLIVRFYDPSRGQILIDGKNLKQIDIDIWRNLIGYVSQDAFLFNDTIFQNILYGSPVASQEDIFLAANRANAHEFIEDLPDGYKTKIGDLGVKLSGGQRQRLALARAILRNPPILILDEATSDLDSKSERLIEMALREISQNRTVIIIAHRLSTVERADNIIVMEEGQIVERGHHETLLAQRGKYAEFYDLQFGSGLKNIDT